MDDNTPEMMGNMSVDFKGNRGSEGEVDQLRPGRAAEVDDAIVDQEVDWENVDAAIGLNREPAEIVRFESSPAFLDIQNAHALRHAG